MNIGGIAPFNAPQPAALERAGSAGSVANKSDGSFGSLVRDAVQTLEVSQRGAEAEVARAVTGETPDLHRTIIALQTADLGFQFGLQVRNKLVGAYEEIMRMQV